MSSKIQFNHIYRPKYFFSVFVILNLFMLFVFTFRPSLEFIQNHLWDYFLIFISYNWLFFRFPFIDPTSGYSISDDCIIKHSYIAVLNRKIKISQIISVQHSLDIKSGPSYYVVNWFSINDRGSQGIC